jgi:hypothetical protein
MSQNANQRAIVSKLHRGSLRAVSISDRQA